MMENYYTIVLKSLLRSLQALSKSRLFLRVFRQSTLYVSTHEATMEKPQIVTQCHYFTKKLSSVESSAKIIHCEMRVEFHCIYIPLPYPRSSESLYSSLKSLLELAACGVAMYREKMTHTSFLIDVKKINPVIQ